MVSSFYCHPHFVVLVPIYLLTLTFFPNILLIILGRSVSFLPLYWLGRNIGEAFPFSIRALGKFFLVVKGPDYGSPPSPFLSPRVAVRLLWPGGLSFWDFSLVCLFTGDSSL